MKWSFFFAVALSSIFLAYTPGASAQTATPTAEVAATLSATTAPSTPSAEVIQKIQDKKDKDITETTGKQKDRLLSFLEENPPQPLSWNNPLEHAVRFAVTNGVPANILVLVLLFPLVASMIAASRHVIGLRGFGIYIPAVLSVALVSTGLLEGLIIFVAIMGMAMISKRALKNLTLSYLPRTALMIWMISLSVLAVLLLSPFMNMTNLMSLSIFPILILILLSENFLDAQASTKPTDALALAVETLGLAFISGFILRWEFLQRFALIEPELLIIVTAVFNILVGKFVGLRLSEWLRFRPIIEE
jgi:hypothetical protein